MTKAVLIEPVVGGSYRFFSPLGYRRFQQRLGQMKCGWLSLFLWRGGSRGAPGGFLQRWSWTSGCLRGP